MALIEREARPLRHVVQLLLPAGQCRPWQDILFQATGERRMDATALVDYFPSRSWCGSSGRTGQAGGVVNGQTLNRNSRMSPSFTT